MNALFIRPMPEFSDTRLAAEILSRRLRERWGDTVLAPDGYPVTLTIAQDLPKEGYRLTPAPEGWVIEGGGRLGLLYGAGKFLRSLSWDGSAWRCGFTGESLPEKPFRAMYLCTHFGNYYASTPVEDVLTYIEDIVLWGANVLTTWFDVHDFDDLNDPRAQVMLARQARFFHKARELGMACCVISLANEAFRTSPRALRASSNGGKNGYHANLSGHYHVEVCPSRPGGEEYILGVRRQICQAMKAAGMEADYWMPGPYDQGGCTCAGCAPWGANGYLRLLPGIADVVREFFPGAKMILSTWMFGRFTDGEWAGLTRALAGGPHPWADWLMMEPIVPGCLDYLRENGIPGGLPVIGFPEISMYGAVPWGGFGANPFPGELQQRWDEVRDLMDGGLPYSEGIFEDLNKAIVLQHYWDSRRDAWDIAREYVSAEYSREAADDILSLLRILERTLPRTRLDEDGVSHDYPDYKIPWKGVQRFVITDTGGVDEALVLARSIQARLDDAIRTGWRWRLLALRTEIDHALTHHGFTHSDTLEACFQELTNLYHAQQADYCVSPPTLMSIAENRGGFSWTSDDEPDSDEN